MKYRGVAQLVAHVVWDHGAGGSNPLTPTSKIKEKSLIFLLYAGKCSKYDDFNI